MLSAQKTDPQTQKFLPSIFCFNISPPAHLRETFLKTKFRSPHTVKQWVLLTFCAASVIGCETIF